MNIIPAPIIVFIIPTIKKRINDESNIFLNNFSICKPLIKYFIDYTNYRQV